MSQPTPRASGKFSAYTGALKAISARTGTPLSSLILSFGIVHEVTAVAPLVIFFYASRALGVGEKVVQTITEDPSFTSSDAQAKPHDFKTWGKQKLSTWVVEGDRWAARVGTRYGIFGYEKRRPGEKADIEALTDRPGHLAGDVANAVVAYAATKVCPKTLFGRSQSEKILSGFVTCSSWSVVIPCARICAFHGRTCSQIIHWNISTCTLKLQIQ